MSGPIINYPVFVHASKADYWTVRDSCDFLIARCARKDHALSVAAALNALNAQERAVDGPQFTLCEDTAMLAVNGACPAHGGDACLREFVPLAQERASEPAACSVCGSATCEGTHMTRDRDYSANEAHMAAALAPAAAPWEWSQEDEAAAVYWEDSLQPHSEKHGSFAWLINKLRAALAHIARLELTLGIAKEQKAMLMEREDALTRALDMQRQATEEAVRRAEEARRELTEHLDQQQDDDAREANG